MVNVMGAKWFSIAIKTIDVSIEKYGILPILLFIRRLFTKIPKNILIEW